MEQQQDRCKIVQIRVNLSDGTPSAKAVFWDVRRTMSRMLKCVEQRAAEWEEYDYAMLDAREELVQMQKALGVDVNAFPLQFGKQTPVAHSKKRAGASMRPLRRRKAKQKQREAKQTDVSQAQPLALFNIGDVVMAWFDTMYYPAQVVALAGTEAEGLTLDVRFLGWETEETARVPAAWTMPVPAEYANRVDLSSYLASKSDVHSIQGEGATSGSDSSGDDDSRLAVSMDNDAHEVNDLNLHHSEAEAEVEAPQDEQLNDPKPSEDIPDKYWDQRYRFFSRFDHGVELDAEGWYSVTPEILALYVAHRCAGHDVIDFFAGVGGNAIAFAKVCRRVCACDINPHRLQLAQQNARVYDVADKIDWHCVDSIGLLRQPKSIASEFSVCLLSPPWGGPRYLQQPVFHLEDIQLPHGDEVIDGFELLRLALQACQNVIYLLPRNTSLKDLKSAGQRSNLQFCLVEDLCLHDKCKMRLAYFGPLFLRTETTELTRTKHEVSKLCGMET